MAEIDPNESDQHDGDGVVDDQDAEPTATAEQLEQEPERDQAEGDDR